ncbi:unnamed protein product [Rotaria magnacalcarata]|uniref:Endonuclease/exonuclease/phosphatase domain-containing protein n=1 Tax=Rotaria magnacalcarata TaxID=392030 RepID=A0A819BKA3_9BILA|nr:unnamed protein product [Rotaria magnacalcarata]
METDLLLLKEKYQDVDKSMKAQDVMFKQFLFPMLDDILKVIGEMNVGAGGRTLDADLKSNFERFRTQMSNAIAETGKIDLVFYGQAFSNLKFFFQSGENRNGGVLILIRNNIQVKRVDCKIPNICIIDLKVEDELRIIGVYAPDSRSWNWHDLSSFISVNCAIFGDFNVDLEHDDKKAESLLEWADSLNLSPFLPDCPTSLRSDRTIDYAFSNIAKIDIQKFDTNTTSDHYPILSILPMKCKQQVKGKSIHWKVFNLFTEYTFSYWEKSWCNQHLNSAYDEYIKFLHLLTARCTVSFPLNKYRTAIPPYLRCFMSYVRALSFRQCRTKNSELKKQVYYLRKQVKYELKLFISSKLSYTLQMRRISSLISVSFWSRVKRFIKPSSSSLHGFISSSGKIVKDSNKMCDLAANFYEGLFHKSENIVRPHPYVDAPWIDFDNKDDPIPLVSLDELLLTINDIKKKEIY